MGGEFASVSDFGGKEGCGHRDECGLGGWGGWREGNRNLRQVKSMASISLRSTEGTHLLWKTQVTIKENKNILILSHCHNYFNILLCLLPEFALSLHI